MKFLGILFICCVVVTSQRPRLRRHNLGIKNLCGDINVEILVSPLVSHTILRRLEIQWENARLQNGDWIGLFARNPEEYHRKADGIRELPPLLDSLVPTEAYGWANTSVAELHLEPDELGFNGKCLNYYVAYLTQYNETLSWTCLRIEPTWMWDLRDVIGSKKLRQVFIPGSHDSSAYGEFNPNSGDTRVKKYTVTQDEPILTQLIHGARYIDLRVGYYKKELEQWWGNHGVAKFHPMRIIFNDIKKFLDSTNEIVILDAQEFPVGFGKDLEVHKLFVEFLVQELGNYLTVPSYGWEMTLDEVWSQGKRLIVGYDKSEIVSIYYKLLFPSVQQKWGNVNTVPALYNYIAGIIERPPYAAWAAMAELTPTTLNVIINDLGGLRRMAEAVNHNVTAWFRDPNWAPKTNVVAVDFIRNSGIVRSAIGWNKNQGQCHNKQQYPRPPVFNPFYNGFQRHR